MNEKKPTPRQANNRAPCSSLEMIFALQTPPHPHQSIPHIKQGSARVMQYAPSDEEPSLLFCRRPPCVWDHMGWERLEVFWNRWAAKQSLLWLFINGCEQCMVVALISGTTRIRHLLGVLVFHPAQYSSEKKIYKSWKPDIVWAWNFTDALYIIHSETN